MILVRFVQILIGLFGATALFWGGLAYDRLPAGWPNYPLHVLFFHMTLHAPGAGAVNAAKAKAEYATAQWGQCQANEHTLQLAIDAQNAATDARARAGAAALSQAESALTASRSALARASARRASIQAAADGGGDVCVRMLATDDAFIQGLHQ